MRPALGIAALAIAMSTAAAAVQQVVVPAYFPLCTTTDSSRGYDWPRIQAKGTQVKFVVPLGETGGFQDPTSVSPTATQQPCGLSPRQQFANNHAVGQLVLGYVDTNPNLNTCAPGQCAPIPKDTVLNDLIKGVKAWYGINTQGQLDPNLGYADSLDGIFFDDGPLMIPPNSYTDAQYYTHYTQLYTDAKAMLANLSLRRTVMLNASQYYNNWVISSPGPAADYITIWEQSCSKYANVAQFKAIGPDGTISDPSVSPNPPNFWKDNASSLTHVVNGVTQWGIDQFVNYSRDATHGSPAFLYLFDRVQNSAYAGLACDFEEQTQAMNNESHGFGKTWCPQSNACIDLFRDFSNCGACANACDPAYSQCIAGACFCQNGFISCCGELCNYHGSTCPNCP